MTARLRFFFIGAFLFFGLGGVCLASLSGADLERFEEANAHYQAGSYEASIQIYEELSQDYPDEPMLFYNLGNSYFRVDSLGSSILAYERALKLSPRDRDIRHNLEFVRSLLEYAIEDKRNWYVRFGQEILEHFTEKEIGFVLLVSYFVLILSWVCALFIHRREPWGWKRKTVLSIFFFFAVIFFGKGVQTHVIRAAIVMAQESEVRYGPTESDQVAFRLEEGAKVYVMADREGWSRILLTNGESGWMRNGQIAEVLQVSR